MKVGSVWCCYLRKLQQEASGRIPASQSAARPPANCPPALLCLRQPCLSLPANMRLPSHIHPHRWAEPITTQLMSNAGSGCPTEQEPLCCPPRRGGLVLGRASHFHANTSLTYPCTVYWVLCPHPPRRFGTNQCVYRVVCFRSALSTQILPLPPTWPKAELGSHAPIAPQDAHSLSLKEQKRNTAVQSFNETTKLSVALPTSHWPLILSPHSGHPWCTTGWQLPPDCSPHSLHCQLKATIIHSQRQQRSARPFHLSLFYSPHSAIKGLLNIRFWYLPVIEDPFPKNLCKWRPTEVVSFSPTDFTKATLWFGILGFWIQSHSHTCTYCRCWHQGM